MTPIVPSSSLGGQNDTFQLRTIRVAGGRVTPAPSADLFSFNIRHEALSDGSRSANAGGLPHPISIWLFYRLVPGPVHRSALRPCCTPPRLPIAEDTLKPQVRRRSSRAARALTISMPRWNSARGSRAVTSEARIDPPGLDQGDDIGPDPRAAERAAQRNIGGDDPVEIDPVRLAAGKQALKDQPPARRRGGHSLDHRRRIARRLDDDGRQACPADLREPLADPPLPNMERRARAEPFGQFQPMRRRRRRR